jgi:hypothetical protein
MFVDRGRLAAFKAEQEKEEEEDDDDDDDDNSEDDSSDEENNSDGSLSSVEVPLAMVSAQAKAKAEAFAEIPSSEAQKTVLSTPDILVLILSQLPHSSLLQAQLVNTTWAGLYNHVQIQAALFRCPRPPASALYCEPYSDLLIEKFFSSFWPGSQEQYTAAFHAPQWRDLLVSQPPARALEIIQDISCRGGGNLEFRTIIPRPEGLRMGFLYDAIRHWHEEEGSGVRLFWHRTTGQPGSNRSYANGINFKTADSVPCVTILGKNSVGCGQWGGRTYSDYSYGNHQSQRPAARIIRSGEEVVEFIMSRPKDVQTHISRRTLARLIRFQDKKDGQDNGDGNNGVEYDSDDDF